VSFYIAVYAVLAFHAGLFIGLVIRRNQSMSKPQRLRHRSPSMASMASKNPTLHRPVVLCDREIKS